MRKRKWKQMVGLLTCLTLTLEAATPVMASEPVASEAVVTEKNGFLVEEKESQTEEAVETPIEEPTVKESRRVENTVLLKLGNISITKDMTMEQVKAMLGEPKLVTKSMLGGSAYTFYSGNYENYIYLETDGDGKIVAYGSISPGFETDQHKYGEVTERYYWFMSGYLETTFEENKVEAAIDYVRDRVTSASYEAAYQRFFNDVECRMGVAKQATMMANAIFAMNGQTVQKEFDEDTFYLMEQIRQTQGISGYDYFNNIGKSSYYSLISTSYSDRYADGFDRCFPNPLELAGSRGNYRIDEAYTDSNLCYYYVEGSGMRLERGFINPAFLEQKNRVPYTQEEQELLAQGRALYQESVDLWNGQKTYYEEEPVYERIPLSAGEIHEDKIKASVLLINAIRASAGIGQLEYSPEITQSAQDKAVMVAYANKNGLESGHYLPQHEGITDEMYQSGMRYMNENLYMCGILGGQVISSINQALDDGYGDPWTAGHRYNLLDPDYAQVGLGEVAGQGVHKFSGSQNSDVDMVAWPSKGIAALESINSKNLNWTVKFYKNYHVNQNTTVQAKLLNSGQTWEFSLEDIPDSDLQDSVRYQIFTGGTNQLAFYNSEMPLEQGNVFEITINGLTSDDGETCSYQYRTVCERLYQSEGSTSVTGVRMGQELLSMKRGESKDLSVSVLPQDAGNTMVIWESENPNVAEVNQYGTVTAKGAGKTRITVRTVDGGYEASCAVEVSEAIFKPVAGVTLLEDETLKVGAQIALKAQIQPADADNQNLSWFSSNEQVATVTQNGYVTGISSGYAAITVVTEDGKKAAACQIYVTSTGGGGNWNDPQNPGQVTPPGSGGTNGGNSTDAENKVPGKVTGLRASKQTTNQIRLSWNGVSSADSYRVFRYDGKKKKWTLIGTVKKTSFTDKKRKAGEKYRYQVQAVNEEGAGEVSTVLKTAAKPAKPALKLQNKGNGKVKLSWKKIKADKIEIFYKIGKKKYKKAKVISGKKTSIVIGKLKKGKTYSFRIRAYTKNGKKVYGAYSKVRKTVAAR